MNEFSENLPNIISYMELLESNLESVKRRDNKRSKENIPGENHNIKRSFVKNYVSEVEHLVVLSRPMGVFDDKSSEIEDFYDRLNTLLDDIEDTLNEIEEEIISVDDPSDEVIEEKIEDVREHIEVLENYRPFL